MRQQIHSSPVIVMTEHHVGVMVFHICKVLSSASNTKPVCPSVVTAHRVNGALLLTSGFSLCDVTNSHAF